MRARDSSQTLAPDAFAPDTLDFIRLLSRHGVRYLLVGGEAVIFYGHVRLTGDVDFFYDRREENVRRLHAALDEFWSGEVPGIDSFRDLTREGLIIQYGLPPNRIDLLNRIDGVSFDRAWAGRVTAEIDAEGGRIPLQYIGLEDLVANKQATARPKDLADLRFLTARGDDDGE